MEDLYVHSIVSLQQLTLSPVLSGKYLECVRVEGIPAEDINGGMPLATRYTNMQRIPLSVAVWLAWDEYDHNADEKHISVTSLLKSTKQLVLAKRIPLVESLEDISGLVPSRMGTAFHNSIEDAWVDPAKLHKALQDLGYPPGVIKAIKVNPTKQEVEDGCIPVYMEIRSEKEIGGWKVSGKFDFVGEGRLEDFKSTGVFTYVNNTGDKKYVAQGSLYRWLNPDIITQDEMAIQFIFTDWQAMRAKGNDPKYPPSRTLEKKYMMESYQATKAFVVRKLAEIDRCMDVIEEEMPPCTDEELWRKEPSWKYYKNPEKRTKSTKNFDNKTEAMLRLVKDLNVGVVVEHGGEVVACKYCKAFTECKQKDALIADGSLKL
jgi:hypothetical protein